MDVVEIAAKTVEEAVELALKELGTRREEVEVEVLNPGKGGFLGFGAEQAKVRVRRLPAEDQLRRTTKEVVDQLLATMKVSAVATIGKAPSDASDAVFIEVEGEDSGLLIGRRGETLRAFQFIVNLLVSKQTGQRSLVMVDVEHYKERRYANLRSMAQRIADRVSQTNRAMTLEPMPANERRIIHLALANHPRVSTQSIGEGENRKVTILPRRPSNGPRPVRTEGETGETV
ncbi:MAG: protein jag [Chloroflexi bacterium]|nr:protein jag [Chloroflexota bacterium]